MKFQNLEEQLIYEFKLARTKQISEQCEKFKTWVENELAQEALEAARDGKGNLTIPMNRFYIHGINTYNEMIHHLENFKKREKIWYQIVNGESLIIRWNY